MTKKTILMIGAIIVFVAVIAVGATFAWFIYYRSNMIVITGDADISVEGWCGSVSRMEDRAELFADPNSAMSKGVSTYFGEGEDDKKLAASQFITYKFKVTNNSERPAMLSLRISNMFDYIFNGMREYIDSAGQHALDFSEIANENNGRLAFLFNYIYYEYEYPSGTIRSPKGEAIDPEADIEFINDPDEDMYIWKYSRDQLIIGNDGSEDLHQKLNKIILPAAENGSAPYWVNLYFSLTNKQGTIANDEYRKWFAGNENGIGVAQEYAANKICGSTWASLDTATKGYINDYVNEFVDEEIGSIITENEVMLNLNLKYFEFIGENASDDDIAKLMDELLNGNEPEPEPEPEPGP